MTHPQKVRVFFESEMVLSHRLLGYLTILLQSFICTLLVYALIIGSGDIVVGGCQRIGFYNYCLYNKTIEDCPCITQMTASSVYTRTLQLGLFWAILLTYSSLVFVMMGILTMVFAQYTEEKSLWTSALGYNGASVFGLSLGMIVYVYLIWDVFDISHVSPGFLAVLVALVGMSILHCIIRRTANLTREMLEVRKDRSFYLVKV